MAYTKILFQDSPSTATPLNAQNFNHMDDQIAENDRRLNELATAGVVNTFNGRTGNVTSEKGDYDINQIVASDGQDGYIPVWRNSGTEQEPDWGFEMESVSGGGGLATCNSVDISFAYVVTPSTDFSITEGLYLSVIFSNNFTYDGVHTLRLSIDSVGYDVKINGQNPTASVIYVKSGDAGIFVFDGTYFQLIGTSGGGHIIYTQEGSNMPQESGLQFADAFLTDDLINGRTVVENVKEVDPADYASTTDEGIIVTDDGDDALIGAVSDDCVEVTADGEKNYGQLLYEIYTDAKFDATKLNSNSYIVITSSYYNYTNIFRFKQIGGGKYRFVLPILVEGQSSSETISLVLGSTCSYVTYDTTYHDYTNIKPNSSDTITLYYGNKKATVDLQTKANRCLMADGVTSVESYISPLGNHQIEYIPFGKGWNGRAYTFIPLLNANKYTITITSALVYNGGSSAVDITSSVSVGNKTRDGFNIDSSNTYVGECVRLSFTVS